MNEAKKAIDGLWPNQCFHTNKTRSVIFVVPRMIGFDFLIQTSPVVLF